MRYHLQSSVRTQIETLAADRDSAPLLLALWTINPSRSTSAFTHLEFAPRWFSLKFNRAVSCYCRWRVLTARSAQMAVCICSFIAHSDVSTKIGLNGYPSRQADLTGEMRLEAPKQLLTLVSVRERRAYCQCASPEL